MKIAMSITFDLAEDNGTTVRAQGLFELLRNSHHVVLIERADRAADSDDKITITPKGTKFWNLKLIPVILKSRPDCVICVNDYFGFLTFYLFSKIFQYKLIFDAHSILSIQSGIAYNKNKKKVILPILNVLEKFVTKHSTYVITASTASCNFYKKYNENICTITHFVDEDLFHASEKALRQKEARSYKLVGLIGPFVAAYRLKRLNAFFEQLSGFDERLKFIIIGDCANQFDSERIQYTGYLAKKQDYIDYVGTLDAALILQPRENFGPLTRVLECMACSVPVFTVPNAIKGLDGVCNGRDLFIFEDNELVIGVNSLIFNDDLMARVATNARKFIETSYSKKANKRKLLAIIEQLNTPLTAHS